MDAAKTDPDDGTFLAPEDRAWLWYNDTIETHAFALRVLAELEPADSRRDGLVQWLFLNKKLNQWKSTRATAEVIYALVRYLKKEGALAVREDVTVEVASQKTTFVFEPDRYTGKRNQVVVPGEKIDPQRDSADRRRQRPARASRSPRRPGTSRPRSCRRRTAATSSRSRGATSCASRRRGLRARSRSPRAPSSAPATRSRSSSRSAPSTPPSTSTCATRGRPGPSRRTSSPATSGTWGSPGTRRRATPAPTSSSSGCRRGVHLQAPPAGQHGRHVPGRAGDGAVDVRPGVPRLLGGGDAPQFAP